MILENREEEDLAEVGRVVVKAKNAGKAVAFLHDNGILFKDGDIL